MLKLRTFFANRHVKIALSLLLIVVGGVIYALFDRFTYFPFLLILIGIIGVVFSFVKLKTKPFYLLLFFLLYMLFSIQHEGNKKYNIKIVLSNNQKKVYFIASNTTLKWKDYLFTWFSSNQMEIDLSDKSILYLNRGIPINITFNSKDIYNKGYSTSIVFGKDGRYEYIVLMPIGSKKFNLSKEKLGDSYYDSLSNLISELNENLLKHKIDSIENN